MPKPFHEWLEEHRRGAASEEWADELARVLEAVQMTGKKGRVTITLDVDPKGRTVVVTDKVDTKVPEADREAAIYFVDGEGSLVRDDPAQQRIQFPVDDPSITHINRETGEIRREQS